MQSPVAGGTEMGGGKERKPVWLECGKQGAVGRRQAGGGHRPDRLCRLLKSARAFL